MAYDCGHKGKPVIVKKGDYTRVTDYYNWWQLSKSNICFECYLKKKNVSKGDLYNDTSKDRTGRSSKKDKYRNKQERIRDY